VEKSKQGNSADGAALLKILSIPYLFDCNPRLLKFFSSFPAAYNQGLLTFFISLPHSKV